MDTPRNTFAPHPASLLPTPRSVMRALFAWSGAVDKYSTASGTWHCILPWYAWRVSRAYFALCHEVASQVGTMWYATMMLMAIDDDLDPFDHGLFITYLVNALLP